MLSARTYLRLRDGTRTGSALFAMAGRRRYRAHHACMVAQTRCSAPVSTYRHLVNNRNHQAKSQNHYRNYSSEGQGGGKNPSARASASTSDGMLPTYNDMNLGPLSGLVEELDTIAPRFELDEVDDEYMSSGNAETSIEVIEGPVKFYDVLKGKILQAKRRIYLSTLYIGTTEHELISTIWTALRNNENLTISFLADALRGTRGTPGPSTASLLAPLITEFGSERVRIRMFHTPNLVGLKKRFLPQRINEGWGLQHMKLYGFDDEIILSGANLSDDYFTNRLDRYHLFRSKALTDYYERVHEAISSMSFDVQPDLELEAGYRMIWPSTNKGPNPLEDSKGYIAYGSELIRPIISPPVSQAEPSVSQKKSSNCRTYVYPIFQLTPLLPQSTTEPSKATKQPTQQSTELPAIMKLLLFLRSGAFAPAQVTFTAGYFNPSPSLVRLLLDTQQPQKVATEGTNTQVPKLDVIAASPYANGFYGSKGISSLLPPAYTLLCRRFLEQAEARGIASQGAPSSSAKGSVRLREWRRGTVGEEGGWTYHAKGIWATLPVETGGSARSEAGPSITLIGSSNYTQRSYSLDLEANALVLTRNPKLQARLREEEEWLGRDAKDMTLVDYQRTERRVGVGVRLAMWIVRVVGGAL